MEPPKGFGGQEKLDMVLRLVKSMYGLKQVLKTLFDKLSGELVERCFTVSNHDQ